MTITLYFDTDLAWIEAIREWAKSDPRIMKVWVFGSRATGRRRAKCDAAPFPDLDIGFTVATRPDEEPGEFDAYIISMKGRARERLADEIGVKLDLQHTEPDTDLTVWPAIQQHGILIFERAGKLVPGAARSTTGPVGISQ